MAAINNKSEMSSCNSTPRMLVLGSGVVGLNTAIRLQMDYPQAEITIMADKFDSELVSSYSELCSSSFYLWHKNKWMLNLVNSKISNTINNADYKY